MASGSAPPSTGGQTKSIGGVSADAHARLMRLKKDRSFRSMDETLLWLLERGTGEGHGGDDLPAEAPKKKKRKKGAKARNVTKFRHGGVTWQSLTEVPHYFSSTTGVTVENASAMLELVRKKVSFFLGVLRCACHV